MSKTTISCNRIWMDTKTFGCGTRDFVVMQGHKFAHLILLATGEHEEMFLNEFRTLKFSVPDHLLDFKRQANRLERNAKEFKNETANVAKAIKLLRENVE